MTDPLSWLLLLGSGSDTNVALITAVPLTMFVLYGVANNANMADDLHHALGANRELGECAYCLNLV